MKKRLLSIFSVLILIFSLSTVSFASEEINNSNTQNTIKVTDEVVCEIATNWAKSMEPELDIHADNVIKIYNRENIVISYSVGYFIDDEPYGYAIVDFTAPGYIGEYNIEAGITDLYTNVIKENEISSYAITEPKMLIGMPYEYAIPSGDNIVSMTGITRSEEDFSDYQQEISEQLPTPYAGEMVHNGYYDDVDIFINAVPATYKRIAENNFPEFIGVSERDIEAITGHYACSPISLAIVGRLGYLDFDISNAFMKLWDYTSTEVINLNLDNNVVYGATYEDEIGPGFVNYARNEWNTDVNAYREYSVQFSRIKYFIDSSILHTFNYGIYVQGEESGHSIVPEGYVIANDNHGSTENFVTVADGWSDFPRYLNFSTRGFARSAVWYFTGISPN